MLRGFEPKHVFGFKRCAPYEASGNNKIINFQPLDVSQKEEHCPFLQGVAPARDSEKKSIVLA